VCFFKFFFAIIYQMSLLLYSPKCKHSNDVIEYINSHAQLKQIVRYHNVNELGIPQQYRSKIDRVPTMLTQNGKILVGREIQNWLESLLPVQEWGTCGFSSFSMTTLSGESSNQLFGLDEYGRSLQPAMTPELQAKISQSVSDAYTDIKK
jgi:hypothetical protein